MLEQPTSRGGDHPVLLAILSTLWTVCKIVLHSPSPSSFFNGSTATSAGAVAQNPRAASTHTPCARSGSGLERAGYSGIASASGHTRVERDAHPHPSARSGSISGFRQVSADFVARDAVVGSRVQQRVHPGS